MQIRQQTIIELDATELQSLLAALRLAVQQGPNPGAADWLARLGNEGVPALTTTPWRMGPPQTVVVPGVPVDADPTKPSPVRLMGGSEPGSPDALAEAEALRLLKIDPSAMLDPNAVYPVPPEAPPAFVVRQ